MRFVKDQLKKLSMLGRSRQFVAVDFDSRQLRIVEAELVGTAPCITKLTGIEMPGELDLTNGAAVGEFLGESLRKLGLAGSRLVMSVPRGQAVLKSLTLPPGTAQAEMAGMVQYQLARELPFAPEEAVIDFIVASHYDAENPAQGKDRGISVLVAAVRLPVVEHYRQIALSAGVKLDHLGLRPCADMRCVEACTRQADRQSLALVHITADEAEIDILEAGDEAGLTLAFSRSALGSFATAGDDADSRPAIGAVVREVARSLQSYQAVEGTSPIEKLLLAGGTGIEQAVAKRLTHLDLQCNLLEVADVIPRPDSGQDASAFISAMGLAIAHAGPAKLPLDFLNPKRPPVQRDVKKIRAAIIAAGTAAVVLAVVLGGWLHLSSKQHYLAGLQEQLEKAKTKAKLVAKLKKRRDAVRQWVGSGRNWLEHWAYLSAVLPSRQDIYLTALNSSPDGSIALNIQARDSKIIADLGRRLSETGYDFKPGKISKTTDPFGYVYSTSARVIIKPDMKVDLAAAKPTPRPGDDAAAEKNQRSPKSTSLKRTTEAAPAAETVERSSKSTDRTTRNNASKSSRSSRRYRNQPDRETSTR